MSESQIQTFLILFAVAILLLVLCLAALMIIAQRLVRIELALRGGKTDGGGGESRKSTPPEEPSGAFGKFLEERPPLKLRPKSEQFAAFRKWRKEQGLNWEGK